GNRPDPRGADRTGRLALNPRSTDAWTGISMKLEPLVPDWAAPDWVSAFATTRAGGVSAGPWGLAGGHPGGLNLGVACGDEPAAVMENRARLRRLLPSAPIWLRQVHGRDVLRVERAPVGGAPAPVADAAVTASAGCVLAIQTADCLPVLFADAQRRVVGAAHAGWRGLAGGWRYVRGRSSRCAPWAHRRGACTAGSVPVSGPRRSRSVTRSATRSLRVTKGRRCTFEHVPHPANGLPTCRGWPGAGCLPPASWRFAKAGSAPWAIRRGSFPIVAMASAAGWSP